MDVDARNQYPIHMVKLVAPMIGVNYQIETGGASLSESNSDCDNKCNWSICGENLINVAFPPGQEGKDINAVANIHHKFTNQKFI